VLLDLSLAGMIVGLCGRAGGYRQAWSDRCDHALADVIAAVDDPSASDAPRILYQNSR
jgi:hypothetical protein